MAALAGQIEFLEKQLKENPNSDLDKDVAYLSEQYQHLKRTIDAHLRPIDHLTIARHPRRPYARDYFALFDPDWIELHGDRAGFDDQAMVGGLLRLEDLKVVAIGTQKGRPLARQTTMQLRHAATGRLP